MRKFKDSTGHEWSVDLNLATVRRISQAKIQTTTEEVTVDLLNPDDNLLNNRLTKREVIFGIIWVICSPDFYENPESEASAEEQFAMRFDGETFEAAQEVLYEELSDFFPELRTTLKTLTTRLKKVKEAVDKKLSNTMEKELSDEKIDQMINGIFSQYVGEIST